MAILVLILQSMSQDEHGSRGDGKMRRGTHNLSEERGRGMEDALGLSHRVNGGDICGDEILSWFLPLSALPDT